MISHTDLSRETGYSGDINLATLNWGKLLEIIENVLLHVLHQILAAPKFSEPLFEFLTVPVAVHNEVQLDIVACTAKAETSDGEVGTAENGVLHPAGGDVIHFSVEEVGLLDGLDVHLALDPVRTLPGNPFLLKLVSK